MTYLEKITYLTGRFLQVQQYVLANAFRVRTFFEGTKDLPPQLGREEHIAALESQARTKVVESQGRSTSELTEDLLGHGLSRKDEKELSLLLRKRDYVVSFFYLDNANALAREDPLVYESKVVELQELVDRAVALNQSLARSADKVLQESYRLPR